VIILSLYVTVIKAATIAFGENEIFECFCIVSDNKVSLVGAGSPKRL